MIRPFRRGDEPALWSIFHAAVHTTAAADYTAAQCDAWAPIDLDQAEWAERVARIAPFVAEARGVAVGYADLQADGYIDHFFVAPAIGRRGVGACLMAQIERSATAAGMRYLYADVSLTARGFFERFGFAVQEHCEVRVRGTALRNFRMSRWLDATEHADASLRVPRA